MTRDRHDESRMCVLCRWFTTRKFELFGPCSNPDSIHYGHILAAGHLACVGFRDKGSLAEPPKTQNDPETSDLDRLLEWANKNRLYIVISGEDGLATVSVAETGKYRLLAAGPTLLTALTRARERYEIKPK